MKKQRTLLIGFILLAGILLDQLTKLMAIHWLRGTPPQSYLGDLFRFQYAENPGAFLSLGSGLSDGVRFWLLTVIVGAFLLGSAVYLFANRKLPALQAWGLALVVSGGISNLIDRLFRTEGRVVDFMNMGIGDLRTGIFNIADMAILLGIGLMLWNNWREPAK